MIRNYEALDRWSRVPLLYRTERPTSDAICLLLDGTKEFYSVPVWLMYIYTVYMCGLESRTRRYPLVSGDFKREVNLDNLIVSRATNQISIEGR